MNFMRVAGVTALCLAVAACGSTAQLDKLKGTTIGEEGFSDHLAREYRDIAQSERDQYDWIDQQVWARKGLRAAKGDQVSPEMPGDWSIPEAHRTDLAEARSKLMKALDGNGRTTAPAHAAKAQAMYDCWVEQREENFQEDDIAACRDHFFAAMEKMRNKMAQPAKKEKEEEPDEPLPEKLVFFAFDSAELKADAQDVVAQMAEVADERDFDMIECIGHADRAGPESYNMSLSLRRADTVKNALANAGVPKEKIAVSARGEEEPLVPTDDGVPEPQNRRVRINFR